MTSPKQRRDCCDSCADGCTCGYDSASGAGGCGDWGCECPRWCACPTCRPAIVVEYEPLPDAWGRPIVHFRRSSVNLRSESSSSCGSQLATAAELKPALKARWAAAKLKPKPKPKPKPGCSGGTEAGAPVPASSEASRQQAQAA